MTGSFLETLLFQNVGGGDAGCFSVVSREREGQEKDGNTEFTVPTFQKHVCGRHRTPGMASPLENLRSGPGGEAYTRNPHCREALMKGWARGGLAHR